MASKGGEARRRARKTTTKTTQLKKKKKKIKEIKNIKNIKLEEEEEIEKGSSSTAIFEEESVSSSDFEQCCTPKAERFKIPEIKICPPAPKKRRLFSNCSLQRPSPIAFFASPDIELFFLFSSQ